MAKVVSARQYNCPRAVALVCSSLFFLALAVLLTAGSAGKASAATGFSAVTVDARTGKVLFSLDPDSPRYPASLTKVMTLYILFQELKAGHLKLGSSLTATPYSAGRPPSRLGLKPGDMITVEDAIRAVVTRSANDVAATIGENLAGTEKAFASRMTKTARSMGMTKTTFRNATGLPDDGQVTTARDIATLSLRIQRDFPEYYPYFRIASFTYKGAVIGTHNRLLGRYAGTDGIKTGYIRASGYNLTTSVARNGKRLVGVVMGAKSGGARNKYMMAMLDKQFPSASTSRTNQIAAMCGMPPGYKGEPVPVVADADDAPVPIRKPSVEVASMSDPVPQPSPDRSDTGAQAARAILKQQNALTVEDQNELATLLPEPRPSVTDGQDDEDADGDNPSGNAPNVSDGNATPDGLTWPSPTSVAKADSKPEKKLPAGDASGVMAALAAAPATAANPGEPHPVQTSNAQAPDRPAPKPGWQIQIGAYPNKTGAMRQVESALTLNLQALRGKTGFAVPITRGSSTLYRARFSGFNEQTARETCTQLTSKGVNCLPLAPQG